VHQLRAVEMHMGWATRVLVLKTPAGDVPKTASAMEVVVEECAEGTHAELLALAAQVASAHMVPLGDATFPVRDVDPRDLRNMNGKLRVFGHFKPELRMLGVDAQVENTPPTMLIDVAEMLTHGLDTYLLGKWAASAIVYSSALNEEVLFVDAQSQWTPNRTRQFVTFLTHRDAPNSKPWVVDKLEAMFPEDWHDSENEQ
jgi:hypothetical protein